MISIIGTTFIVSMILSRLLAIDYKRFIENVILMLLEDDYFTKKERSPS
jgi:hypothetical protein